MSTSYSVLDQINENKKEINDELVAINVTGPSGDPIQIPERSLISFRKERILIYENIIK